MNASWTRTASRTLDERGARASRSGFVAATALCALLGCGSDDDGPNAAETAGGTLEPGAGASGPSSGAGTSNAPENGASNEGSSGAPTPGNGGEVNEGLGGNTPLAPSTEPPPGATLAPDALDLVEIAIPTDLPGCSPPYPHDPAVDLETGLVYYAGSDESCIGQYNPETGAFQAWPTATPDSYPHGLIVVDGVVYFTGQRADLIGSVDPSTGEATDFPVAADGPHTAVFHEGAIWFTAQSGGQFGRLDPVSGASEIFPFEGSPTGPYGIWPAPDSSLWVALFATNQLARIDVSTTPPTSEQFTLPEANARPRRIAVDAAGKVWYTDFARSALGLFDPSAPEGQQFREFPTPGGGRPYGIAVGPDGRVWYNDQDAAEMVGFDQATESVVARLPIEIEDPGPVRNITVDQPRRRLWLALSNVGQLAVIQF